MLNHHPLAKTLASGRWQLEAGRWRLAAITALLLVALAAPAANAAAADSAGLDSALQVLTERSFRAKQGAVTVIAESGGERAVDILRALLKGHLYYRKADKRVVIAVPKADGVRLTDAATGADLGEAGKRDLARIPTNNQMRSKLHAAIAALSLNSPKAAVRLAAVKELLQDMDPETAARFRERLAVEENPAVRGVLETGIALAGLKSVDAATRQASAGVLAGNLRPVVGNRLRAVADSDQSTEVRAAARKALERIDLKLSLNAAAETLFFGLSLGSVLVLAAIGLAITFGVMGVINMAHGELIMLGAYTTYLVQQAMPQAIEYSLLVAVPAAFLVAGLFGVVIERLVIRFLYGRPLETLLATFGISLVLQQLVRTTISAQNVVVENPAFMSGSLQINPALSVTYNRLYIIVFGLAAFAALLLILKRTVLGLQVRAVSQNRAMARAMGVRSARVDALTFGLGAGIAGVAGVALSQLTNVGPNMGQGYIIDSFMVVVFGGVGNLWGTLIGGLTLGVANKVLEPWSGAVLAKILVLVFIILFIQKRPSGLFPQRGRAAEG